MKTLFASATIVATCFAVYFLADDTNAQTPRSGTSVDYGVRVIDVKRIFDEYDAFGRQIKQLREEVKRAEEAQVEKTKKLQIMAKEAQARKPGSEERKDLEKKIFKIRTDLAADAKIQKAEFMEKEAKIYYHTYNVIKGEVAYYCKVKNVAVVISYNSEKANPNDRNSVMRAMTSSVVAQNGVDITDTILRVLNRGSAPPPRDRRDDVSRRRTSLPN